MRQAIVGCLLTAIVATFALTGGAAFYYYVLRNRAPYMFPGYEPPIAGVRIGAERFAQNSIPAGSSIGTVTDILYTGPNAVLEYKCMVTDGAGIQPLNSRGDLQSYVPLEGSSQAAKFAPAQYGDSHCVYSSVIWPKDGETAAVYDLSGRRLWEIDTDATYAFMEHGDTTGDGTSEFLFIEYFEEDEPAAIALYEADGQRRWAHRVPELVGGGLEDLDGDGIAEFLTIEGSNIVLRDADGNAQRTTRMQSTIQQAWSVEWPLDGGRKYLLTHNEAHFAIVDDEAKPLRYLDATGLFYPSLLRAASLRFVKDGAPFLAVLVASEYEDYSQLYIYDEEDTLVYYEVIDEYCGALHVAKDPEVDIATLLVGGSGRYIAYGPSSNEAAL